MKIPADPRHSFQPSATALNRRRLLRGFTAVGVGAAVGFPAIIRGAQAEIYRAARGFPPPYWRLVQLAR